MILIPKAPQGTPKSSLLPSNSSSEVVQVFVISKSYWDSSSSQKVSKMKVDHIEKPIFFFFLWRGT